MAIGAAIALAGVAAPAAAQEISENRAWQFETPQELAARTAALDVMMKRRGGIYAAPVYNTTIARQNNCSVSATAAGNSGTQSALANSPTVTGPTSTATGNSGTTQAAGEGGQTGIEVGQHNGGSIGSSATGLVGAAVTGPAWQALNSTQANSGDQQASVASSTACGFGAIN
ncbi:hypothetical protein [Sphingomonas sp.]|uniref:hypothetical protein n=1 Tax=Sphingomonas sp. TaxID=28214 RepID=UPI003F7153CF